MSDLCEYCGHPLPNAAGPGLCCPFCGSAVGTEHKSTPIIEYDGKQLKRYVLWLADDEARLLSIQALNHAEDQSNERWKVLSRQLDPAFK